MEGFDVHIVWVFLVGVLSFFSPCNFALIPTFIAYISGSSSLENGDANRRDIMTASGLFVLGFMLVFLLIRAGVGALSRFFVVYREVFSVVAGLLLVVLGLIFLFHLNINLFKREYHLKVPQKFLEYPKLRAFMTGTVIAFGWSPCYGPLIGAILTLVLTTGSTLQGIFYFFVYSIGFVIPFLLLAFFINAGIQYMDSMKKVLKYFHIISGLLLIVIGIIMMLDQTLILTQWLYDFYDVLGIPYVS